MNGGDPRFLFDEMVHVGACEELRRRGVDVVHALRVDEPLPTDREVLELAREQGRVVVTRNYGDFRVLARAYARRGRSFPGVLFLPTSLPQADVGAHVRAIEAWIDEHAGGELPIRDGFGWV